MCILDTCSVLREVCIGFPGMPDSCVPFWNAVARHPSLEEVVAPEVDEVDHAGVEALRIACQQSATLSRLNINSLGVAAHKGVVQALTDGFVANHSCRLSSIQLQAHRCGDVKCAHLSRLVASIGTLRTLYPGPFLANHAALLEAALLPQCRLKNLYLGSNEIDEQAAAALRDLLSTPGSSLISVDFDETVWLSSENPICTGIGCSQVIEDVVLDCELRPSDCIDLGKSMRCHFSLRHLQLRAALRSIEEAVWVKAISTGIEYNDVLETLDLSENSICNGDVAA